MTSQALPEICTPEEVAAFLKTTPAHIKTLARKRRLRAFQIGSRWRFHQKDIYDYIEETKTCPEKTQDRALSGGKTETFLRSSGSSGEAAAAKARAQAMLRRHESIITDSLPRNPPTTGQVIPMHAI
jgi:excisionase family DNA binding protein